MARCAEAFRHSVVARRLPPESASVGVVSTEVGVSVQKFERWRAGARLARDDGGSDGRRPRFRRDARARQAFACAAAGASAQSRLPEPGA